MKVFLLLAPLFAVAPAMAQPAKPYKPESDGAYFSEKDRTASAAARRPFGAGLDSTLTGLAALDAHNGFRRYIFGTPVAGYPTLNKYSAGVYWARKEPLLVGNAPISDLRFQENGGLLTGATFTVFGQQDVRQVLEALKTQYGPPQETGLDRMTWRGQVATLVFETKTTDFNAPITTIKRLRARVVMYNNALMAKQDAAKAATAKKAAGDL